MGRVTASEASQSPPHRHILRRARTKVRAFFSHMAPPPFPGSAYMPRPGYPSHRPHHQPVARPGTTPPGVPQAAPPPVARPSAAPPGIPQAAPPPVARPGAAPPGIPQAAPPVTRPGAAPPGKCCENNKARDIPGFAHSLAFSNRLSTFAGKALNARSHRW